MNSKPATPKARSPRERNTLLKKYYGLKDNTATTAQSPLNKDDIFDIDGSSFNANKYFASLMKEKTLYSLLEKDNQLVGEIREIDGDMKTLVYENYSKFISATDTIRKMKTNVENMESEMGHLNENVECIVKQLKDINQHLGPHRQKIQELSNAHNSLKRLQFIFQLPTRLQHCLDRGKYSQAVKYYSKASPLLNHNKHMAAFKGIDQDCKDIMEKVKTAIWNKLAENGKTIKRTAELTKMLLVLEEEKPKLWKQYVDMQLKLLHKRNVSHSDPATIEELLSKYVEPLEEIVHHFAALFLSEDDDTEEDTNFAAITIRLSIKDRKKAKDDLSTAIKPFTQRMLEFASKLTQLPEQMTTRSSIEQQLQNMGKLKGYFKEHAQSLLRVIEQVQVGMDALCACWEDDLIKRLFGSVQNGLHDRLNQFLNTLEEGHNDNTIEVDEKTTANFIQDTQAWIKDYIVTSCLFPLRENLDTTKTETAERLRAGLKTMWHDIQKGFGISSPRKNSSLLLLLECRLCYDLADNVIFAVYSASSSQQFDVNAHDNHNANRVPESDSTLDPLIIPDFNEIIDLYLKKGQSLLNKQMLQEGYRVSCRLQKAYLYSDKSSSSVYRASLVWDEVFSHLRYMERLLGLFFPQQQQAVQQSDNATDNFSMMDYNYGSGPYSSRQVPPSTHSLATMSSISEAPSRSYFGGDDNVALNMMSSNIDKLFAERIDIYRLVEPTTKGVCSGLIMIILKAFVEVTREIQIDKVIYQQLQLDVEYVKSFIWPYVGEEKWASSMLQEVLSSMYTRCNSPVNLTQDEIISLLSNGSSPK